MLNPSVRRLVHPVGTTPGRRDGLRRCGGRRGDAGGQCRADTAPLASCPRPASGAPPGARRPSRGRAAHARRRHPARRPAPSRPRSTATGRTRRRPRRATASRRPRASPARAGSSRASPGSGARRAAPRRRCWSRCCAPCAPSHPKADLAVIERAFEVAAKAHARPEAQERRPVHHAPGRRRRHPRRAGHDAADARRRAAARHGRGHRLRARRSCAPTSATRSRCSWTA